MNSKTFYYSLCVLVLALASQGLAFSSQTKRGPAFRVSVSNSRTSTISYSTVEIPTREDTKTDRKTNRRSDEDADLGDKGENFDEALRRQGPLEYLEDADESREIDDPFHILLLSQTFEKPKITVDYVVTSLGYVLGMPSEEAQELTQFSYDNGMSCLGTWKREECLSLGKELQVRDIVCRVVPYCQGGQRGWQAKDANLDLSNANYE
jgi:hypothetical protein